MARVFKIYFTHWKTWGYILVTLALFSYLYNFDLLQKIWPLGFLVFLAPFIEWFYHKYALHADYDQSNPKMSKFMEELHVNHHKWPSNIHYCFAPFLIGLSVPLQFFVVIGLITWSLDWAIGAAFVVNCFFLFYEWIHLAHHVDTYRPITEWGKNLKKAHKWHHFKNEKYWWGVTSSFADKVLGTYPWPNKVPMSETVKNLHPETAN